MMVGEEEGKRVDREEAHNGSKKWKIHTWGMINIQYNTFRSFRPAMCHEC